MLAYVLRRSLRSLPGMFPRRVRHAASVAAIVAAALALPCGARIARADTPVADPGFPYVDVNNDGKYSVSDGDIGLTSSPKVDIAAIIKSSGTFDDTKTVGTYHAPAHPASLVIPASQTLTVSLAIRLNAGANLRLYGTLNAPSICLTAQGSIDLTGSTANFNTFMTATAGGSATLDGSSATGAATTSQYCVMARTTITANPVNGNVTGLVAGGFVNLGAGQSLSMSGAALVADGPTGHIALSGYSQVQAGGQSTLTANGSINIGSNVGAVSLTGSSVLGAGVFVTAATNVNLVGSQFSSLAAETIQAGGTVTGNTSNTNLAGSSVSVTGAGGVDLSNAPVASSGGTTTVGSTAGPVALHASSVTASGGLSVHASGSVDIGGSTLSADHAISFTSDTSTIAAAGSTIQPDTGTAADTAVTLTAPGNITLTAANWAVNAAISINSSAGSVTAESATLDATGPGGTVALDASGQVDITNAKFQGAVSVNSVSGIVLGP